MSDANCAGALEQRLRALLKGLEQEFPGAVETVRFGGQTMSWAEMVAQLKAAVEAFDAVHRAQLAHRAAVSDRRRAMKGSRSLYEDAVFFLKHYLGKDSPRLPHFGVALPKPRRALTVEANAVSRAKAAATRKARGTLGKRQRQALGKPKVVTLEVFGVDGPPSSTMPGVATPGTPAVEPEPSGTD
jgi:hypothetical protein